MARPSKAQALGSHVSHVVGLDGRAPSLSDYDPEDPTEIHETHEWIQYDRWAECDRCGTRDYWPGAGVACIPIPAGPKRAIPVTLGEALDLLRLDLEAFRAWWASKGLGDARPTLAEWTAEFLEWTARRGGRRE